MTTDDAPRPALDAATLEVLREAAMLLGPLHYLDGGDRFDRAEAMILSHADALIAAAAERDKLARQIAIACDDAADDLAFIAGYVDTCFDQRPADEWPSWLDMDVVRRRAQAGLERLGDRKRAVRAPEEGATDGE